MSDTPVTDKNKRQIDGFADEWVPRYVCEELERKLTDMQKMLRMANEEWAEDDTHIEKVCEANRVPEQEIYGDSYGVPDIQMKVTSLVRKLGGSLPENEKEQQS